MPRPACVRCFRFMRCKTNDVAVVECPNGVPTRVWNADLWRCEGCGAEILTGYGTKPNAEWSDDVEEKGRAGFRIVD